MKVYFNAKISKNTIPLDTGRKLNVHKTFRRRPGRLLNVLCTFNLRPVSRGIILSCTSIFLPLQIYKASMFMKNWEQHILKL